MVSVTFGYYGIQTVKEVRKPRIFPRINRNYGIDHFA